MFLQLCFPRKPGKESVKKLPDPWSKSNETVFNLCKEYQYCNAGPADLACNLRISDAVDRVVDNLPVSKAMLDELEYVVAFRIDSMALATRLKNSLPLKHEWADCQFFDVEEWMDQHMCDLERDTMRQNIYHTGMRELMRAGVFPMETRYKHIHFQKPLRYLAITLHENMSSGEAKAAVAWFASCKSLHLKAVYMAQRLRRIFSVVEQKVIRAVP